MLSTTSYGFRFARIAMLGPALVAAGCAGSAHPPPTLPPPKTTALSPLDIRDGQCLAGVARPGEAPRDPLSLADCSGAAWDVKVLAVLRDGSFDCPPGANQYLSVPLGPPTYRSETLCLERRSP